MNESITRMVTELLGNVNGIVASSMNQNSNAQYMYSMQPNAQQTRATASVAPTMQAMAPLDANEILLQVHELMTEITEELGVALQRL